jgi:hypothetical protein
LIQGCASNPPSKPNNLCSIFLENNDWYDAVIKIQKKWGVPIQVPMAMMYQESSFKADARPPMNYALGFIPTGRASSAYGYSQAKTSTWNDYMRETNNSWRRRNNFEDAIDFMGWFISKTHKINKISKWDAYHQYLNYHEGWGGYKRKTYRKKNWLIKVAKKVDRRAKNYSAQYKKCKYTLDNNSRSFF